MNSYDSKSKFNQFSLNAHYLRVDEFHPLELLIGLNENGQKTIRLKGKYNKTKLKSTRTIEVSHFMLNDDLILSFSLVDDDYEDLFYIFCNDLIDSSRLVSPNDGYTFIVNRYDRWRTFGSFNRKYLSENEIKGLLGELIFLKEVLARKYGISSAIEGWTGPEPLKKDFSFEDFWYEVKVANHDTVTISSLEQLDSENEGYMILYHLEKMSAEAKGLTLNTVVNEIFKMITLDNDRLNFIMKLASANFFRESYYDQFVFVNNRKGYFRINHKFPRLNRQDLPNAIADIKYELIINMLEKFKVEEL
ncbi:PD-(D/E)XK motif protein [Acholeplasma equirhinis]|uniref:PD-(D/E)XK motif protein n=1 Tax=Acholeplasma equirhinis TaxID=555393 RepID=UPI00197AD021|nr:PD-(D/E)XK motif protein [Acholeplasma equirhinis]MBN3489922.1 PD-(D/E)XK motif protein [Acholeplasma equirhinis]